MTASATEQLSALDDVAAALARAGGRSEVYRAVDEALQRLVGHRLFTLLAVLPGGEEVQRFWSSDEAAYPLTGRKRVGPTPWGAVVLKDQKPWLGENAEAVRWAFADHELIAGLGLGSVINIPIVAHGRLFGTMNLLHVENHFNHDDLAVAARFMPPLAPAFAEEVRAIGGE